MVFMLLVCFMVRHTPPVCRKDVKECRIAFTCPGERIPGPPETDGEDTQALKARPVTGRDAGFRKKRCTNRRVQILHRQIQSMNRFGVSII